MHKNCVEYRLSILCYVAAMAESTLTGTCPLDEQSTTEHRLLLEFYWMLHKIPEYLVQTNCMDCCKGLHHTGERQACLQELWEDQSCKCADAPAPHDAAARSARVTRVYPPRSGVKRPNQ
jgi:hypothetical protein